MQWSTSPSFWQIWLQLYPLYSCLRKLKQDAPVTGSIRKWMLSYRTVSLAQTLICSGIYSIIVRSLLHQSPGSLISASTTSSPQWTYINYMSCPVMWDDQTSQIPSMLSSIQATFNHAWDHQLFQMTVWLSVASVSKTFKQVKFTRPPGQMTRYEPLPDPV
jgi:hypothetical protein